MTREEYSDRLRQELAGVHVSPALRHRTLSALKKKEQPIMKKKISTALVFVMAMLLLGTVALAAAGHWDLLDFVGRYGGSHVPSNAPDYIQKDMATWETNTLSVALREMYYDGRYLQAVVDVKAQDEKTLLVSGMYSTNDYYCNLLPDVSSQEDSRTIAQYFQECGYEKLLLISPIITSENDAGQDCCLQEDGTLTFYLEAGYREPQDMRDTVFRMLIQTCTAPENNQIDRSLDERVTFPLTLTVPEGVVPITYVCNEPQDFPEAGVRIDRLTIEALPLSIYTTIEYSVMDEEQYVSLEDALWFEFIDPESPETLPALQRLDGGLTGSGGVEVFGNGQFIQRETLGVNELHAEYTLRAYNAWTKERYETRTFTMQAVPEAAKLE